MYLQEIQSTLSKYMHFREIPNHGFGERGLSELKARADANVPKTRNWRPITLKLEDMGRRNDDFSNLIRPDCEDVGRPLKYDAT